MMKRIAALLIALPMLTVLAGCRKTGDTANVDPVKAVADVGTQFMEANADQLPAFMEMDDDMLKEFYGVDPAWLTAYVCRVPMMNVHATEFFVAHVKDGHMEDVKSALEARQSSLDATWSMYLPEQYELVKSSQTVEKNGYILYAVTEHMDSIKEIFEKNVG